MTRSVCCKNMKIIYEAKCGGRRRREEEEGGGVSGDWNVYYIGYSLSHLSRQLIKYLIKFLQGAKENTNELTFASPPLNGI